MKLDSIAIALVLACLFFVPAVYAQAQSSGNQNVSAASVAVVPQLIKLSGTLLDAQGKPIATGPVGVTFALYAEQTGGASLWLETQNVHPDENGYYTVLLGNETSTGVPMELFASGEARWLGIQIERQPEQARVLLVSVPYALKAGDAQTLGGRPASDFALANASSAPSTAGAASSGKSDSASAASASSTSVSKNAAPPVNPNVTGKGVLDHIPMWDTASDIVDSVIFQKSSDIGIGTVTPAATLDVNGKGDIRDTLTLFPKGTDSTLAVSGTAFKIDQTGKVTFISAQTFPGAGTITADNSTEALKVTQTGTGAAAVFNVTKSTDTIIKAELNGSAVFSVGATGGLYDSQQLFTSGTIANDAFIVSPTGAVSTLNSDVGNGASAITANQNDSNSSDITFGVNASTASSNGVGVKGTSGTSSIEGTGGEAAGVWGDSGSNIFGTGVLGTADDGMAVVASSNSGSDTSTATIQGFNGSSTAGALVFLTFSGAGGNCSIDVGANLSCSGKITGIVSDFKLDHPQDPANKYLVHTSVQSSEMMNIYTGNIVLDANGAATIQLPSWFQAENADFRYQLTAIGSFSPVYVAQEIQDNQFKIAGGNSGQKISWQVTGVRQDAYAKANPLVVEQEKTGAAKGRYLAPALFGQPGSQAISNARRPNFAKRQKSQPAQTNQQ
jgi:trimeric autotransporter adhesin